MKPFLFFILLFITFSASAHEATNLKPLVFGADQTIVDLTKLVWGPLKVEGLEPGAEIALLRGDLGKDHSESILRLPPGYTLRQHTHTSDELYVWISGAFTLTSDKGVEKKFSGPAYISFPGNAPTHGLKCGDKEPCIFYLRYSRPFDIKY
jgi:quercetin dioxygenase-like cupin family protein